MTRIKNLKKQVQELSREELAEFRDWFVLFDAEAWDHQIEADVKAGKLDTLAENALRAHAAGQTTKL